MYITLAFNDLFLPQVAIFLTGCLPFFLPVPVLTGGTLFI